MRGYTDDENSSIMQLTLILVTDSSHTKRESHTHCLMKKSGVYDVYITEH